MQIINRKILINTEKKKELINITDKINSLIQLNSITDAIINIQSKHTTAGIIIAEDEEGLKEDYLGFVDKIVQQENYKHDMIDNNARSHLQAMIYDNNQTLPVTGGRLNLGTWQSIFLAEFDGPRKNRTIEITILTPIKTS